MRHASIPLHVRALRHRDLRAEGLFKREWHFDAKGQGFDLQDKRPFSTEFAFTRFLTPWLFAEAEFALFVDCDFVFTADVVDLLETARDDPSKALWCVKHPELPQTGTKMDGVVQAPYRRKNWSSLMLYNLAHEAHQRLTTADVNTWRGADLHALSWLDDDEIGALPEGWNWLAQRGRAPAETLPEAIHYTVGGPWMGIDDVPHSLDWYRALLAMETEQCT
jgi:lipopolysaccharide biosynthesis glycosyltransferase